MQRRKLGGQGLEVAAIGLGCMGMSALYAGAEDAESTATLHRALDLGVDFLDTSQAYGPFKNEELVGQALKGRRDAVVVATKFGFRIEDGKTLGFDSRPEEIRRACDSSLKRLRIDCIDLYYQHRVDKTVPIEDVAGAVGDLVREGKVRYFGLSEASPATIRRAHAVFPVSVLQTEFSLWERGLEVEHIPTLRELGIGLVPYSPLGRGFLTGKAQRAEEYPANDFRRNDPRFQGEHFDANMRAAGAVREVAEAHGATPAQVALAWVLAQGADVVPIPGASKRSHLEDNLAAATLSLTAADVQRLEGAMSSAAVAGNRYNAAMAATLDN